LSVTDRSLTPGKRRNPTAPVSSSASRPTDALKTPPPGAFSPGYSSAKTDTHGNTIVYVYSSFPGSQNINQKYLTGIRYGPGAPPWNNFHFVTFVYEDRPDWFEDCRAGFIVRTGNG